MSDKLDAVLDEIEEFLEDQADVRDSSDGNDSMPLPNRAMSLLAELQQQRSEPSAAAPQSVADYIHALMHSCPTNSAVVKIAIELNALINAAPQSAIGAPWTKCSERLPGPETLVSVWVSSYYQNKGGHDQAMLLNGQWTNMRYRQALEVTHWMPLPSAPTDNTGSKE